MALRSAAQDLARLFDAVTTPVYALDHERRIVFLNDACVAWAGCEARELRGREARYHSSTEVSSAEAIAAALAPPPEVWSGTREVSLVTLPVPAGASVSRSVQFIPLGSDPLELSGVLALASPAAHGPVIEELTSAGAAASPRDLHDRLARWRRKLGARFHCDRLVGESASIRRVRSQVELAMESRASVAICGPAGSGREHVARAIHYGRAASAAGPLVPLACPLLSPSLLEATIRSFTREQLAMPSERPATLLLTDVDSLAVETQEVFLRSLAHCSQIRVIVISKTSLTELSIQGEFLPELATALSTLEIHLPRLADRLQDLPLLAQMLVEECNRRVAKQVAGLTPEAIERLAIYSWPGNIAELSDVITAAHGLAEGAFITSAELPAKMLVVLDAAARPRRTETPIVLEEFLARIEDELIRRALTRAKGNKTKAARLLGMTRPRLYRRLVQLGLAEPPAPESGGDRS